MSSDIKTNRPTANWPLTVGAVIVAGLIRLIPFAIRPPNIGALGALSLYAGARLPWYAAFALPLAVMYVTDLILWSAYDWKPFNPYVYGCYLFSVALGLLLRRTNSPWKIGFAAILADVLFFLVTNYGAWRSDHGLRYPETAAGLEACYVAAWPFFRWTLLSTLIFVPALFGTHAYLAKAATEKVEV